MDTPFKIFKINEASWQEVKDKPPVPHRHNHEEILIIKEGTPDHFIDFYRETLQSPMIVYIAQGKTHQFIPKEGTYGWAIRYETEFLPGSMFHYYSYFLDSVKLNMTNDCIKNFVEPLCTMMLAESENFPVDYEVIKHLLGTFIYKLESESKKNLPFSDSSKKTQLITFNSFLKILENNFKRNEGVEFYSEKMNMSARNLNVICRAVVRKSVSELIETRKMIEARQLLLNSNMTVAEIGYELGYNEKSYFTRVFHKKTGLTPSAFRQEMASRLV